MSEFKIEHSELKRCDLLKLAGRIDSSKAPLVEDQIREIMDNSRFKIVIDMSRVEYVSSAYLRVLITSLKKAKRWNRGNIYLAAMSDRILDVFDLAGLKGMFQIYPTVEEAVGDW